MKAYLIGLGLSMFLSIWCLINIYRYDGGFESLILTIIILIPGLMGLYFSTKIKSIKLRWLFLVVNYLFATWGNVTQFLWVLSKLF